MIGINQLIQMMIHLIGHILLTKEEKLSLKIKKKTLGKCHKPSNRC